MKEQNVQGESQEQRGSQAYRANQIDQKNERYEYESQGDLLSSPRHSELSLISESTAGGQNMQLRDSQIVLSKKENVVVRDPNFFIHVTTKQHNQQHYNNNPQQQNWPPEVFPANMEDQMQMYQTQQQQASANDGQLGQTMGAQALANRMSQIVQRQSYPQAPITDRQMQQTIMSRDSMDGARQGLQGAAHGGSSAHHGGVAQLSNNQRMYSGVTNSVTNDRLSSVQFILSQSDRASQNNYINIADANAEADNQKLYLQWSLTQSGGPDSIETESHAKKPQLLQNFYSANSFNPATTVKSEDYMSQFNSVSVPILTDSQFKQPGILQQLRPGEHQKPIIVNSMAPMADCSTPSPSLQLGQIGRSSSSERKDNAPQEQHAGEYDHILSSPSINNHTQPAENPATERTADVIAIASALDATAEEDSHAEALRVVSVKPENRPSVLESSERQSTEMQRFSMLASSQVQNEDRGVALGSEAYQTTVLSPEEAVNTSLDQQKLDFSQSSRDENQQLLAARSSNITKKASASVSLNCSAAKPPLIADRNSSSGQQVSSATAVKQDFNKAKESKDSDGSSDAEDEDSVAMISVRAATNPQFSLAESVIRQESNEDHQQEVNEGSGRLSKSDMIVKAIEQQKLEHSGSASGTNQQPTRQSPSPHPEVNQLRPSAEFVALQAMQLPLPHELFSDSRPSEFEQPILSAKVSLPREIFAESSASQQFVASPEEKESKSVPEAEASPFTLDSLESQAKHAVNNVHSQVPTIDYQNLPINVSNLLLQRAADSLSKQASPEEDTIEQQEKKEKDIVTDFNHNVDMAVLQDEVPIISGSDKKVQRTGSKHAPPRLEIGQLEKDAQQTRPLILTDSQQLLTDGGDQSSSMASKEDDFGNSMGSDQSPQEEPQPELKPEELERQASSSKQADSSTISLSLTKQNADHDRLIQVSDLNNDKGLLNQSVTKQQQEDEQISYLISRQTSQDEQSRAQNDESTSLIFSQTNHDERMTLTSMGFTQEKQFPNQPTTSRKHYLRGQQQHFPQTSEKKMAGCGQLQEDAMRQQSPNCSSSFNNTMMGAPASCASRHSYFVNALGQRISSDVLCNYQMHPADSSLQSLFNRQNQNNIGQVQEFGSNNGCGGGGDTMSTIPDETCPHKDSSALQVAGATVANGADNSTTNLMNDTRAMVDEMGRQFMLLNEKSPKRTSGDDGQLIRVGLKEEEQSAQVYQSTTKQSVTEINFFNSIGDKSTQPMLQQNQQFSQETSPSKTHHYHQQRQMTQINDNTLKEGREYAQDQMSIKRNLNLLEAFKTQQQDKQYQQQKIMNIGNEMVAIPDKIHIQQQRMVYEDQIGGDLDYDKRSNAGDDDSEADSEHLLMKSSGRQRPLQQYQDDHHLPVFRSHEHQDVLAKGAVQAQIQTNQNNTAATGYSLGAQQNFFQRYHNHAKSNSMSTMHQQLMGVSTKAATSSLNQDHFQNQSDEACSTCILNGNDDHCRHGGHLPGYADDAGSFVNNEVEFGLHQPPQNMVALKQSRGLSKANSNNENLQLSSHHVTQEYFAEEYQNNNNNHHGLTSNTEHQTDDLTDDDIAVFRSQLNDIPAELAQERTRRMLTTNVQKLQSRHQDTFLLSIVEEEPVQLAGVAEPAMMTRGYCSTATAQKPQSTTTNTQRKRRSREVSLSTYQATEDDNTGTGLADRLSPKFEKLQQLMSLPSHHEHVMRSTKAAGPNNLMLRTIEPSVDGGILSPPLASNPTTKSFLHRIATYQKQTTYAAAGSTVMSKKPKNMMVSADNRLLPPNQPKMQQKKHPTASVQQIMIYPPSPGNLSEDDQNVQDGRQDHREDGSIAARDCQTTTNQESKRRPSLMSALIGGSSQYTCSAKQMQSHQLHLQHQQQQLPTPSSQSQQQVQPQVKKRQKQQKIIQAGKQSEERRQDQEGCEENTSALAVAGGQNNEMAMMSRQQPGVPRDLQHWLSSLGLSQYGLLLVEQGLDDLQSLVQMMRVDRVLPLTHEVLEAAGIESSGHRARLLVNLELEAGVFEQNQEVIQMLQSSTMSQDEIVRQADLLFQTGTQQVDQMSNNNHGQTTPDNHNENRYAASPVNHRCSPLTEQILKGRADRSPLRPPQLQSMISTTSSGNKFAPNAQPSLSLSKWLAQNNLLFLQPMFVRSGYECLRTLILQTYSLFNKLTDATLKNEIGIDKIGHRMRILSQLRQDALVLFQMELLYRTATSSQQQRGAQHQKPDDGLFVLPGGGGNRQQSRHHFKSAAAVYTVDDDTASTTSQASKHGPSQAQAQVQSLHQKHLNPQQPQQQLRPRNYSSYSNKAGTSESVPSSMNTTYRQYQQLAPQPSGLSRQKTQNQQNQQNNSSYIKDHLESNLNPWRHSTYFDQSRPVVGGVSIEEGNPGAEEDALGGDPTTRSQQVLQLMGRGNRLVQQRNHNLFQHNQSGTGFDQTQSMPQLPLMAPSSVAEYDDQFGDIVNAGTQHHNQSVASASVVRYHQYLQQQQRRKASSSRRRQSAGESAGMGDDKSCVIF